MNKQIFKKWWFWLAVVVVLGAIGAAGQSGSKTDTTSKTNSSQTADTTKSTATLPTLNAADYKGKEGLVVYKELKSKGYTVDADFEKQALTDINGKASDMFEKLDPNKADDRQSVDAFVVGDLTQTGDSVKLTIAHQPTN